MGFDIGDIGKVVLPVGGAVLGSLFAGPAGGLTALQGGLLGLGAGGIASSALAAEEANDQNVDLARETNQSAIELANTAHQREMLDLEKAGLNPILTGKYGGSATPSLTVPKVESLAPIYSGGSAQAVQTMLNTENLKADVAVKQSQVQANSAQAVNAAQDARRKAMENDILAETQPYKVREAKMRNRRSDSEVGFGTTMTDIFGTCLS